MSDSTKPPIEGPPDKHSASTHDRQLALLQMWKKVKLHQRAELKDLALLYSVSPGLPFQYLHGYRALNERWMLRFALYMKMAPQDIWPDWEYRALTHRPSAELTLINERWPDLTPQAQHRIMHLVRS